MTAQAPKSRFGLKLLVFVVVVGAGAAAIYSALRPTAAVEPVVSDEAQDVKSGNITVIQEQELPIRSELAGRVLDQDYDLKIGAKVAKGQILARLDPGDLNLTIEKDTLDRDTLRDRIENDHSSEINLATEQAALENTQRFHDMGNVSDLDLANAKNHLKISTEQGKLKDINNKHDLAALENQLKVDNRKLNEMTIKSPIDGELSNVPTSMGPGVLVNSGDILAMVISEHRIVEAKISEEDFAKVKVGDQATVTFIPYDLWLFKGKVTQILPTADPETQRHIVYLDVQLDADHPLVSGINGEAAIIVDQRPAKAIVPRRALRLNNNAVWVVKDGIVEDRRIKRGYEWATGVEILEGLAPGEKVIVDQVEKYSAGEHLKVQEVASDAMKNKK